MLINNDTHQRETLSERPIWLSLRSASILHFHLACLTFRNVKMSDMQSGSGIEFWRQKEPTGHTMKVTVLFLFFVCLFVCLF